MTSPPGDEDRLFIVEQGGRIRIFENGAVNAAPFLDVSSITSSGGERGLLGLAFHPDYASNGWFYINRGVEQGIDVDDWHRRLSGKRIGLTVIRHWTPLDWKGRGRPVAELRLDDDVVFTRMD